MTTHEKIAAYIDRLERWLKAHKDHPGFDHGPEPMPEEFHIKTEQEQFAAQTMARRSRREVERTA